MRAAGVVVFLVVSACSSGPLVVESPLAPQPFTPLGAPAEARDLIGHEASIDGQDVRVGRLRPGCVARPTERPAVYEVSGRSAHHGAAYAQADLGAASFGGRIAAASSVDYRVQNIRTVTVETEGDCGAEVVRKVYVGTGTIRFLRSQEASGGASAVGVGGAGAEEQAEVLQEVRFEEAAYAVEVGAAQRAAGALRVDVQIPESVVDGTPMEIRVFTNQDAFVLVAAVTEAGESYLLLPSGVNGSPRATAEAPLVFPGPEETRAGVRLVPRLPEGATEATEFLLVWAFRDENVFRDVIPLRATASDWTAESWADLEERIRTAQSSVAPGRIADATREYKIVSAPPAP